MNPWIRATQWSSLWRACVVYVPMSGPACRRTVRATAALRMHGSGRTRAPGFPVWRGARVAFPVALPGDTPKTYIRARKRALRRRFHLDGRACAASKTERKATRLRRGLRIFMVHARRNEKQSGNGQNILSSFFFIFFLRK
jgi:hypothetical protein